MKDRYDFSKGKRGRVLPAEPEPESKTRITIRLDQDIVDRFLQVAQESGGTTGYQTLINAALREYHDGQVPKFEDPLLRIIREELKSSAAVQTCLTPNRGVPVLLPARFTDEPKRFGRTGHPTAAD